MTRAEKLQEIEGFVAANLSKEGNSPRGVRFPKRRAINLIRP